MILENKNTLKTLLSIAISNFDSDLEAVLGEANALTSVEELESLLYDINTSNSLPLTEHSDVLNINNAILMFDNIFQDEPEDAKLFLLEIGLFNQDKTMIKSYNVLAAEYNANNARIEALAFSGYNISKLDEQYFDVVNIIEDVDIKDYR